MRFWGRLALLSSVLALIAFSDISEDMHDPGWPALEQRLGAPAFPSLPGTQLADAAPDLVGQPAFPGRAGRARLPLEPAPPGWRDKLALATTAVSTSLLNLGLKLWFARARPGPDALPLVEEPYYSFPSGHAMISLVVYGWIAYLVWRRRPSVYLMLPFLALVCVIAGSRVYLAAHYPGDVLAGLVAGWPCLCLGIFLHRR